ncbi:uncharacterized protein [Zea mays]|uniref:uncharacterized protein n=1 Tax=Zea mays TaxID=4577 RepID=UPI001652B18E|nr:uncharacterized protein LOC103649945 [Zea mays]
MNGVYNLTSQYILPRWTKYAKSGFYIEKKQGTEEGDLKTQAALISRQATTLALKCSSSKELLDKLQKAMYDFNLEADTYLSEMHEKSNEIPPTPNECVRQPLNGVISFKIPPVIKGPKQTRFKNVLEKNPGKKKKKGARKKGDGLEHVDIETRDEHADANLIDFNVGASSTMNAPFVQGGYANVTMPQFNLFANPSAMAPPYIPGGYTSLLMGVDQDDTTQAAVRKLHFDESM